MKEDEISNGFELIDAKKFVQYASVSHIYKVNKFQAKLLNEKYEISIYYCIIEKECGDKFTAYLANLGGFYGNEWPIGNKMFAAIHSVFTELEPDFGNGK
jgi:hypothetical protein